MRSQIVESCVSRAQNALMEEFTEYAKTNECGARALAIPVVLVDTLLQVVKIPLAIVEYVAFAAINLLGAAFSERCHIQEVIFSLESVINVSGDALKLPLRLLFMIATTLHSPEETASIKWNDLGKPDDDIIDYLDPSQPGLFTSLPAPVSLLTNDEFLSSLGFVKA